MTVEAGSGLPGQRSQVVTIFMWYLAALAACLWVFALNGHPLFYFDTADYVAQGRSALAQIGLYDPTPAAGQGDAAATGGKAGKVVASRSIAYALLAALLSLGDRLSLMVLVNAAVVILALWLLMRVAARNAATRFDVPALVALPLIVCSVTALPFYVAYLMPDIYAPVLLIMVALLTVFARQMRVWEILLAMAMAAFAVVAHLSHLGVAGLLIPVALIVALILDRRRWWLPPLLVALVFGAGIAERKLFRVAAEHVASTEVFYNPFITARLIEDGPGLRFLETRCPDPAIATCALGEALKLSDDPWRLTATHIIFETSPQLGSFRLMTADDQRAVAQEQVDFFKRVLIAMPAQTVYAFVQNTLLQTSMFSVEMTLPSDKMIAENQDAVGLGAAGFTHGPFSADQAWLRSTTTAQAVLYALSVLVIAVLLAWPGRVPGPVKATAVMLVMGVLVNAFVCGGVSQPASRYGARVIWLLPAAATMMLLFSGFLSRQSKLEKRS